MKFEAFPHQIWLATPTMHGDEMTYVREAYETNWMSTEGANLGELEKLVCQYVGCEYAVPLSSGTAALHMAVKLAGICAGDIVLCTDMTFAATVNAILYEKAIPVFIDTEYDTWNMDPVALEKAFEQYPHAKAVMIANLYGTPAKLDQICAVAHKHGAIVIEDAAESLGATYQGRQTGTFGAYNVISFNGNKIITGSSGGMLLTNDFSATNKARKWSTQSRENAPWYQHEEIGYNYRMSNVIAGVVRGQMPYLDEHIERKKEIYQRYKAGFADLPVTMNPYIEGVMEPNFWLSCILIDKIAMCHQVRGDNQTYYVSEAGKSCPDEILETLAKYRVQGRPIWKPMHMQPIFQMCGFVTREGGWRGSVDVDMPNGRMDVGADIFERGLCLPSDVKMSVEEQNIIIEMVKSCFE